MQILRNTQKGLFFKFVLKFIYKSVLALRLPQLIIRPAAINEEHATPVPFISLYA